MTLYIISLNQISPYQYRYIFKENVVENLRNWSTSKGSSQIFRKTQVAVLSSLEMRILPKGRHIPCKLFKCKFESPMTSEEKTWSSQFVNDKHLYSQNNGNNRWKKVYYFRFCWVVAEALLKNLCSDKKSKKNRTRRKHMLNYYYSSYVSPVVDQNKKETDFYSKILFKKMADSM